MADVAGAPAASWFDARRRLAAEALGTGALLAAIVGSGLMGERMSVGDGALALLTNAVATGAALVVLITTLGPVSGAHFNPAVTLVLALRGVVAGRLAAAYVAAQLAGAVAGVAAAHLMFAEPWPELSAARRGGAGMLVSEALATFGLVLTILACLRFRPQQTAAMVGLYILSAYWFTASTSFANPAVTLARTLSDSFAGIAPAFAPGFVAAQLAGAVAAGAFGDWLFRKESGE